jgi:hypothetical protein
MTETMEVPLNRLITSLAALGRMPRIACGATMVKNWRRHGSPSDLAASSCPGSTEMIPARMISAE